MKKILALVIAILLVAPAAWAANYSFDVSWLGPPLESDPGRSGTLGFENWYVWKYEIKVIDKYVDEDGNETPVTTQGHALSNWVLELPNCYMGSELFEEIEASAVWGGGDKVRVYDPEAVDPDPNHLLSGLKWEFKSGDELDTPGEWDYFWFSAPSNIDVETSWSIKAGNTILASGQTRGPDCPGCPEPGIPEPMSIVLMGTGIAGLLIRNRKRGH